MSYDDSDRDHDKDAGFLDSLSKRCPDTMVAVCVHFPTSPRRMYFRFFYDYDRTVVVLRVAHSFLAAPVTPTAASTFLYVGLDKTLLAPLYKTLRNMRDDHADTKQVLHFTYTT